MHIKCLEQSKRSTAVSYHYFYYCEVSQGVATETLSESTCFLISEVTDREKVPCFCPPGLQFHTTTGSWSRLVNQPLLSEDDGLEVAFTFGRLSCIMYCADARLKSFPSIFLLPPRRVLLGRTLSQKEAAFAFSKSWAQRVSFRLSVFKSANVIFVSNYNEVRIPQYTLDFPSLPKPYI